MTGRCCGGHKEQGREHQGMWGQENMGNGEWNIVGWGNMGNRERDNKGR